MNETCPTCGAAIEAQAAHVDRVKAQYGCGAGIEYARVTGGWQFNRRLAPCGKPPSAGASMEIKAGSALGLPTITGS